MTRPLPYRYVLLICMAFAAGAWGLTPSAQSDKPAKEGGAATSQPSGGMPEISTGTVRKLKPKGTIPAPTVVLKPGEAPKPKFESLEYDFGTVAAGTEVSHAFEFKNIGTGMLEILAVRPSCGCTTSGDYDKVVAPGAEGKIPIKVGTAKFSGPISKSVSVHTNAAGIDNLVMLAVKGTVKPLYVIEPTKLEFGPVKLANILDKTMTESVVITNESEKPLELTGLRSSNPNFKTALKVLEPGKKYEIEVVFGGTIRTGSNGSTIEIDSNFEAMPDIRIPAAVFVEAPLEIMPSQLLLTTNRKVPFTRAFFIQNNTGKAETLSDLRTSDPKLKARMEETTPGMAWKVVVDIPPDYEGLETGDTLSLKTSNPEIPELVVDIVTRAMPAKPTATSKPATDDHAGHGH